MIEARFRTTMQQFLLDAYMKDEGIILLSGENGSGKTTFLKSLAGLISLDSGSISINGRDITNLQVQERRVVYANQNSYFGHLTIDRHIIWPGVPEKELGIVNELKENFGINYSGKLKDLSMGQRMRVTVATAFAKKPEVILLDEVVSNISKPEDFMENIRSLARRMYIDVVFVAHSIGEAFADHLYSLESGVMKKIN